MNQIVYIFYMFCVLCPNLQNKSLFDKCSGVQSTIFPYEMYVVEQKYEVVTLR